MGNYYDLNVDTPLQTPLISGVKAIEESIFMVLRLSKYSVPFQLDRKNVLQETLFEFATPLQGLHILNDIDILLKRYEPRIRLIKSKSYVAPYNSYDSAVVNFSQYADSNDWYQVQLTYSIYGMDGNQTLSFLMKQ